MPIFSLTAPTNPLLATQIYPAADDCTLRIPGRYCCQRCRKPFRDQVAGMEDVGELDALVSSS